MANLNLTHIYKVYPNGVKAVNDFNINIENGEFVVFVGPSGCGKSTTLRMIAGLEDITSGELFIDGELCNYKEPKDRDIAMVFQNYALYPHMTVFENMAYGLRNRKIIKEEINQKVTWAAKMLDLTAYLTRKPSEMSGGQKQRVALGRALVRDPKVFLLDEPLSNLDAKLRAQMRTEITKLHQKVQSTFIYVTHDQVEAMTMGTRIVVMKDGFVQQIDTPINLYKKPANKFVAGFIGTPQMNFFKAKLLEKKGIVDVIFENGASIRIPYDSIGKISPLYLDGDQEVIVGFRPENIHPEKGSNTIPVTINVIEQLGNESIIYGEFKDPIDEEHPINVVLKGSSSILYRIGDVINVSFDADAICLFDPYTEQSIVHEEPKSYLFKSVYDNGYINILGKQFRLPQTICERLGKDKEYLIEIPVEAFVDGEEVTFSIEGIETGSNGLLAKTSCQGRYFYFPTEIKMRRESISKDILFDLVSFMDISKRVVKKPDNEEENVVKPKKKLFAKKQEKKMVQEVSAPTYDVEPVNPNLVLDGRLPKEGKEFYFETSGLKVPAIRDYIIKAAAIDGRACHKKTYGFIFPVSSIEIVPEGEGTLTASVEEILDYGRNRYASCKIGESSFLLPLKKDQKLSENQIHVSLDFTKLRIISKENGIIIA